MASPRALYTPEILAAAAGLAAFPWDETLLSRGEARSRACGSTLAIGLGLDGAARITRIGIKAHACAIGQASADIFARAAPGLGIDAITIARHALGLWLAGEGEAPDWPGIALIARARDYPARHGAILLAWDAAIAALS